MKTACTCSKPSSSSRPPGRHHAGVDPTGTISRTHDPEGVSEADDLTLRAARALKAATGSPLGARITLTKHIPMGAGLGGGSSDAATVLLGLNELWQTGLSRNQLIDIARPLGADVPIFVHGQNAYATGIGDVFQPVPCPNTGSCCSCPTFTWAPPAFFRPRS